MLKLPISFRRAPEASCRHAGGESRAHGEGQCSYRSTPSCADWTWNMDIKLTILQSGVLARAVCIFRQMINRLYMEIYLIYYDCTLKCSSFKLLFTYNCKTKGDFFQNTTEKKESISRDKNL